MSHRTLHIGNLSHEVAKRDLQELCEEFGEVLRVSIPEDRETGERRGFAFVGFGSPAAAAEALESLNGFELEGRRLRVSYARTEVKPGPAARRPPFDSDEEEELEIRDRARGRADSDIGRSKARGSWKDQRHRESRRGGRHREQGDRRGR